MNWQIFYNKAYTWILSVGPKLLIGIVLVIVGLWCIRLLKKWLNHHLFKREITTSLRPFLVNLIGIALQVLLLIAFLQIVGLQVTIFTALIGAIGVAAGLALSGTLQNFTGGVLILLLKPFRVNDIISAQGNEGTVEAIQLFFTLIRTYDNRVVVVPNSQLSNQTIVNLSCKKNRRLDIEIKFAFSVDYNKVKATVDKSIAAIEDLLKTPAHRIGVSSVESDGYKVMVSVWAPAHRYFETKLAFQQVLMEDLKTSGLKLPGM